MIFDSYNAFPSQLGIINYTYQRASKRVFGLLTENEKQCGNECKCGAVASSHFYKRHPQYIYFVSLSRPMLAKLISLIKRFMAACLDIDKHPCRCGFNYWNFDNFFFKLLLKVVITCCLSLFFILLNNPLSSCIHNFERLGTKTKR